MPMKPTWYEMPRSPNHVAVSSNCGLPVAFEKSNFTSPKIQNPTSARLTATAISPGANRGQGNTQSAIAPPIGRRISVSVSQP